MALSVAVNGQDMEAVKNVSVKRDIGQALGTFNFAISLAPGQATPVRVGDRIQIKADGTTVVNGFAEIFDLVVSQRKREIKVSGRDKTSDILDSSIRGQKEWSGPISLKAISDQIISDMGADIQVVDDSEGTAEFLATDILSATPTESAFKFIEKLGRKRQVTVTTNIDGNLQFIAGRNADSGIRLIRRDGDENSNVKDLKVKIDYTKVHAEYRMLAQQNPLRLDSQTPPETIVNTVGTAENSDIRASRYLEIDPKEDMEGQTAQAAAEHELQTRLSQSFAIDAVIAGHSLNGSVPAPGTIVTIVDDVFGIDTRAVVRSFQMTYTTNKSETSLSLSRENAYSKRRVTAGTSAARGRPIEAEDYIS